MRPVLVVLATAVATAVPLAGVSAPASVGATGTSSAKSAATSKIVPGRYIVLTKGAPLAAYSGGVKGIPRTKPIAGHKLNVRSAAAKRYKSHLLARHANVLAKAGLSNGVRKTDYSVAFNGFAAKLTKSQAARLAQTPGVLKVWPDELRTADTISTPRFLGLDGPDGVWQQQFQGPRKAGRGMIVGDIDSGIWPESDSFAAFAHTPDQAQIDAKWSGTCDPGVQEPVACNNKLIGARYYGASFGNDISHDFNSPRDFNGHGTHTASTAAGRHGVEAIARGVDLGQASGMAPGARIAMYKALWETTAGTASGTTTGLVKAIDDAVADGVDVINYSISGSSNFIVTPDELAFANAAAAGVFVSTSAGNSGPTASTVAHNAPWEITVAASTHDRGANKTVTLGDGQTYPGLGYGPGVGPATLIDSVNAAKAGATAVAAELCYSSTWPGGPGLDPAKVAGKIVLCKRGTNDRVDKSKAVSEAGGVGMILFDADAGQSPTADFHSVPSIHVNSVNGTAIKTYADTAASPTATISAMDSSPVEAPAMGGFSSTGPAIAGGGDLLKPDITAPGVSVIAAVAPPGNQGLSFNAYDGTSMAAPHITGIAALILQKHPTWSPMWVKSALMTGATTLDNRGNPIQRGSGAATPLDYGAGHVRPAPAFDPGLVYDNGPADWVAYACAIGQWQLIGGDCSTVPSIDPSDFNSPSISIGGLPGSQTVTRTVTNAAGYASHYTAQVEAPAGTTVQLSTSAVHMLPGRSLTYSVKITRTTAPLNQWTFGSITWTDDKGHSVRIPIAVKPVVGAVPAQVTGNGTSGSKKITVQPGYTGTLTAAVSGLVPAHVDTTAPTAKKAVAVVPVTIPAGTTYARFATYDADYAANTDIDLVVKRGTATVGSSGGSTAEESVNLNNPTPGAYTVEVTYFDGAGATLAMKLNSFALSAAAAGNMTVSPTSTSVTSGTPVDVTATWSGLQANTRYLGAVTFGDGTATFGRTLVNVLP
jgi:subtilisin family serine protease